MSNQMKHTPGPWSVLYSSNVYPSIHAGPTSAPVASLYAHTQSRGERDVFENADANARLIAAAPVLLEALRETLSCIDQHTDDVVIEPIIRLARAAIAKATGGAE